MSCLLCSMSMYPLEYHILMLEHSMDSENQAYAITRLRLHHRMKESEHPSRGHPDPSRDHRP